MDTQTSQFELSLADAMHQFDAGDRNRCGREALEAQHRGNSLFHAPMVLLDQIVQVLRRPQLRLGGQQAIGFQLTHRAVRRGIAVQNVVTLVMDGGLYQNVEGNLKSVWAKLEEQRSVGEQKRSPFTSP